jgi:hypothetical protein
MSGPCECAHATDRDPDVDDCLAEGPNGDLCTRPEGHDGPHTACNVVEHPGTTWSDEA